MKRAGLVDCNIDKSKTSGGYQPMTQFWIVTELGKKIADEGPGPYPYPIYRRANESCIE